MLERTFRFILNHRNFKILGSSRTDAMVSANCSAFELFVLEDLDTTALKADLNKYLPPDIRIETISKTDATFNIINDSKQKEYIYLFSHGEKLHPFAAPLLVNSPYPLDIVSMNKAAQLFVGEHNFKNYCYKPKESTSLVRSIDFCHIEPNTMYQANFFPKESYMLRIKGAGFLRNQVRIIMGVLFEIGKGTLSVQDVIDSLEGKPYDFPKHMAPPSGLILNNIIFHKPKE